MFGIAEKIHSAIDDFDDNGIDRVWDVPDISVNTMKSNFSLACNWLIYDYCVLPLICRTVSVC